MDTFIFKHVSEDDLDDGVTREVSVSTTAITWPQLTEEFIHFLRGCGFVFDRKSLLSHFHSHFDDILEAEENAN